MTDETSPNRMMLYGRRKGRPLRKQRQGLLDTLLPRLELTVPPGGGRIDAGALFDTPKRDLWFEVGFGGGEHLAETAAAHPDVGFIGAEPFINGTAGLLQHIDAKGLTNIRIVPDDARPAMDALPDACLGRVYVLFPDPWPKVRHAFRRFVGPENLPRLSRLLKDGGELRLATDDMQLCRWMLEHTFRYPDFEWLARTAADWRDPPDGWPGTRYEQKAREEGRTPVFLNFRRRPRG
ncbi:tRNA (guanine(46)-N(7))-methyltransferase TrmB [Indioceanicola profundi]|uniref:tRNA (guanine(46)-N(7))-methyltransferase TrmB n=1 Tax=Indioceanicola profundi TaxID=2220096 RepID=UPI000E6ABAF6|nr:tRNA (guanine(46)-N(7))-methyltransferase TrmB [Indioceanicola profundi]